MSSEPRHCEQCDCELEDEETVLCDPCFYAERDEDYYDDTDPNEGLPPWA